MNITAGASPEAERERLEEKKRLLRLLTPREREEMMAQRDQWARKMAERDKAQRAGEQPAIEVQSRRLEDKNGNGSNGAGGK